MATVQDTLDHLQTIIITDEGPRDFIHKLRRNGAVGGRI